MKSPIAAMNDTEVYVYNASLMQSIGDIAPFYPGYTDFNQGVKLTDLTVGSGVEGYSNTNMSDFGIGRNVLLEHLKDVYKRQAVYINGELIDLRDNTLTYTEGFLLPGNFSFVMYFYGIRPNQELLLLTGDGSLVRILYRLGKFNTDTLMGCLDVYKRQEQGQLEELQAINKELALQQDIEEHRAKSASREAANKAVDAYNKQYGKYDISENKVNNLLTFNDKYGMSVDHENDISGNIAELQRTKELLNQAEINYKKAIADEIDTEYYSDELQRYINLVDAYKTQLDDSIADLSDKRIALEEEYNRVIEKRNLGESPLTTSEQNIISTYEAISAAIRLIYQYTNPSKWNSMEFSNIFNKEGIEKSKEELIDLAEAGKLDEEDVYKRQASWIHGWTITPQVILSGMISGLGSTGMHQLFKQYLEKKQE